MAGTKAVDFNHYEINVYTVAGTNPTGFNGANWIGLPNNVVNWDGTSNNTLKAITTTVPFDITGLTMGGGYYVKIVEVDTSGNRSVPSAELGPVMSGTTQRSNTLVLAANNSSLANKAGADYVCDGTSDEYTINEAMDSLPFITIYSGTGQGGANITNLLTSGQSTTALSGFTAIGNAGIGFKDDIRVLGAGTLLVVCSGSQICGAYTNYTSVTANQTYTASFYLIGGTNTSMNLEIALVELNSSNVEVGATTQTVSVKLDEFNTFTRYSLTRTFGSTGVKASIRIKQTSMSSNSFCLGRPMLIQGSNVYNWIEGGTSSGMFKIAATDNNPNHYYSGGVMILDSGSGQSLMITSYDSALKCLTLNGTWTNIPDSSNSIIIQRKEGTILMQEGSYYVTSQIIIRNKVTLDCRGTIYDCHNFLSPLIIDNDQANGTYGFKIMNATIISLWPPDRLHGGTIIELSNSFGVTIDNVRIKGVKDGLAAISLTECEDVVVSNCSIEDCDHYGILVHFGNVEVKNNNLTRIGLADGTYGIYSRQTKKVSIVNNTCESCYFGIGLDTFHYGTVSGNKMSNSLRWGLYISNSSHNNIIGNNFFSNGTESTNGWSQSRLSGGSKANNIQSNIYRALGISKWAIEVYSGCPGNFITNNDMYTGGVTAGLEIYNGEESLTITGSGNIKNGGTWGTGEG